MMRSRVWILGVLILAANVAAGGEGLVDRSVGEFLFRGRSHKGEMGHLAVDGPVGIGGALLNLATHTEVPIAIEALPEAGREAVIPIEIDAKNTTVGKILTEIVRQDPRYSFRERLGIIEVLPVHAGTDPGNCLNMVLPEFRTDEAWTYVVQSLRCQIDRVSTKKEILPDPIRAGVCGGGSFGLMPHPPPGVIRMSFQNEPLRDVLDKLAVRAGNIAWEASYRGPAPACDSLTLSFNQPRQWFPSDGPGPVTWSEGLPEKCLSCHYHNK